jgi:hypothetical protein
VWHVKLEEFLLADLALRFHPVSGIDIRLVISEDYIVIDDVCFGHYQRDFGPQAQHSSKAYEGALDCVVCVQKTFHSTPYLNPSLVNLDYFVLEWARKDKYDKDGNNVRQSHLGVLLICLKPSRNDSGNIGNNKIRSRMRTARVKQQHC